MWWGKILLLLSAVLTCSNGWAIEIDTSVIPDPNTYLNSSIADAVIQSIGLGLDHRPYEGATPLGTAPGIEFGVEVTLAHPPSSLTSALSTITGGGTTASTPNLPVIPSARFQIHKGISDRVDIGFSYLPALSQIPYIGGSTLFGADLKVNIYKPEEGPSWAIRLAYSANTIKISPIAISTTTFSPQLLFSKKLDFAEPYLGAGYQITSGTVQATITIPTLPAPLPVIAPVNLKADGKGRGGVFFGGLTLVMPHSGLRFTIEGAYSTAGVNYVGSKLGFLF